MNPQRLVDRISGMLLGTAVGDAIGLPAEGMTPQRIRKRFPGSWRHRFLLGRGMISDDTEHAFLVTQSLIAQKRDRAAFQKSLARSLAWWFIALPAGIGLAAIPIR